MDSGAMFPELDLIDAFLELYNRTVIKKRDQDINTKDTGKDHGFKSNGLTEDAVNLDDSDYILKDFNPLNKTNVWLDQSLDKY